ncbi:hypothetical protein DL766_004549 [Monosporascus sp. MC13-8B]|uniref:Large ribosomal subunit protein mL50 n=1 Tax=Monosporascus cannonballus TaxID=155416 RepID=A0ABY0HMQ6_9PEZI|nr:hypothetical protein DL763_005737 [Monosporascus cannonballus]RYO94167.1 hypothetical protein DL762_000677 [Monosporascus cannonballus]RYP31119.1 hypothetical protein DL766_004549 [Monosporascus sp. MC13-8B]
MRRIARLRRPSGPAVLAAKQPIPPLACPSPAARASIHTTSQTSGARPPTVPSRSLRLARFYSTENQAVPRSLVTPGAEEDAPLSTRPGGEIVGEGTGQEPERGLYVTPPRRTTAKRPDEIADTRYVPATIADGLESVGGLGGWWEKKDHWKGDFVGFRPKRKIVDPLILEAAVRRAVAEAFALRQAGRNDDLVGVWPEGDLPQMRRSLELDITVAEDGQVSLNGDVAGLLDDLSWKDGLQEPAEGSATGGSSAPRKAAKKTVLSAEEVSVHKASWDASWKFVALDDPRMKFAVMKRIFQLTGQLVPDHKLPEVTNVHALLRILQKPPKPQTLTEEILKQRQELVELPNVTFSAKRVTRGDKEKAVGRFKLIEEELRKRDLPLEGHGFARKNKEREWLKGGV